MGAKNPIKMKLLSFFSVVPLIAGQETIGLTIAQPPSEVVAQPDLPVTADLPVPDLPATGPATGENEVAEDDSSEIIPEPAEEILMTSVGTSTTLAPPVLEEILPTSHNGSRYVTNIEQILELELFRGTGEQNQ